MIEADLQLAAEQLAIREVLDNYCRAMDRMDKPLAQTVFDAASRVNYHGMYEGSGNGFIDWVWESHAALDRHSHQITNVLIEVDGDSAVSEAYITVALWTLADADGKQQEIIGRGRYLDRWRKLSGRWTISEREFVMDMHSVQPLQRGELSAESRRDRQDASYRLFGG